MNISNASLKMVQRHVKGKSMYVRVNMKYICLGLLLSYPTHRNFLLHLNFVQIKDRQDLSEALLVQGEVREHDGYIEDGNAFSPAMIGADLGPEMPILRDEGFYWGDAPLAP